MFAGELSSLEADADGIAVSRASIILTLIPNASATVSQQLANAETTISNGWICFGRDLQITLRKASVGTTKCPVSHEKIIQEPNGHRAGIMEARVGVEPTNGGFADLSLRPLGYRAGVKKYNETGGLFVAPASFCGRSK